MFMMPAIIPWPGRVLSIVSGGVLLIAGTAAGAAVLMRHRRRSETPPDVGTPDRGVPLKLSEPTAWSWPVLSWRTGLTENDRM